MHRLAAHHCQRQCDRRICGRLLHKQGAVEITPGSHAQFVIVIAGGRVENVGVARISLNLDRPVLERLASHFFNLGEVAGEEGDTVAIFRERLNPIQRRPLGHPTQNEGNIEIDLAVRGREQTVGFQARQTD